MRKKENKNKHFSLENPNETATFNPRNPRQERNDIMTDSEILKLNLKGRVISEKRLIEIFGTPTIMNNYKKNGHFIRNDKYRLMDKAKRFCNIVEKENKQYYISDFYNSPRPSNFDKMNKELYQYICPLILDALVNGKEADEKRKCTLTVGLWAREIQMVNYNYEIIKEAGIKKIENEFKIRHNTYYDFYNRCDETIDYYIIQALKYLYSAGLIIWRDVYFVQPVTPMIEKDGEVYEKKEKPKVRQATEDEMKFYAKCVEIADEKANITNAKERYYSTKASCFRETLIKELNKGGILYIFKSYEAYYVNRDRCKAVLDMFDVSDNILDNFNAAFISKLATNAEARKLQPKFKTNDNYIDEFLSLCDMTINNKTENLEERINGDKNGIE